MICEFCDYEYPGDDRYGCPNCCGEGLDPLHQILLAAKRRLNQFAQASDGSVIEDDIRLEIHRISDEMTPESEEEIRQIYALHPGLIDLDLACQGWIGSPDPGVDLGIVRVNIETTISDYLWESVDGARATLH